MATYQIPYQNLSIDLPDQGELFRGLPGAGENDVMTHFGGKLYVLPGKYYQGNLNALPAISPGKLQNTAIRGDWVSNIIHTTDFNLIKSLENQRKTGEVITQTISPVNPHQTDITSNLTGNIKTTTQLPQAGAFTGDILGARAPEIPKQELKPVSILSSQQGKKIALTNDQKLAEIESALIPIKRSVETFAKAKKAGMPMTGKTTEEQAVKFLNFSTSSAGANITEQVNQGVQEGLGDFNKDQNLKNLETDILSALSAAKIGTAVEKDLYIKQAQDQIKQYNTEMTQYLKDIQAKRAERAKLEIPGEKEKELTIKANNLKTEIEQIQLANEKRKFDEYEAQNAPFAARRGQEFDIRTSFQIQEKRLELQNVLGELGIEQGMRGMQLKSAEQALDDFKNDFELQTQIEEKISKIEDDVLDKANKLETDAINFLGKLLDNLEGINPNELSSQSVIKLKELSDTAGIPYSITQDALKVSYQKQVYENATKAATQKRAEESAERQERRLELAEKEAARKEEKEPSIFNKEEQARLKIAGIDEDTSTNITRLLLANKTLDEIRGILKQADLDPALLDKYDRAVGIEKVRSGMLKKEEKEEKEISKETLDVIANKFVDTVKGFFVSKEKEYQNALLLIEKNKNKFKWSDKDIEYLKTKLKEKLNV